MVSVSTGQIELGPGRAVSGCRGFSQHLRGPITTNSNVTPIESKQPAPSCRFSITVSLSGFPVVIEGEGRAGDLKTIIDRLLSIGAEPPQASTPAPVQPTKPAGAPLCPAHGTPMKASRKPGSYFCPRQAEDGGGYCPHKA